ncbi:MAG: amino acid transporter [Chloroflexota bacterium]|nr:amino acid transporter [Chloroflexota bacterium]
MRTGKSKNMSLEHQDWDPISTEEAKIIFGAMAIPWWIAGGVALDLYIGQATRVHGDLDVLILREDQLVFQQFMSDWDLHKTSQPGLKPWPVGEYLEIGVNQVWCRKTPESKWCLEVMFMDTIEDEWVYRRANGIKGSVTDMGWMTSDEIPCLLPEIQLLYKARLKPAVKDSIDFETILPYLSETQKHWLQSALKIQYPNGHPWIIAIDCEGR